MAGAGRDHGRDRLAPAFVGNADDDRVEDVGVTLEYRLDLLGEHLFAARVDALRSAPEHRDRAIVFDDRAVARYRPTNTVHLGERRGGLLRVLVVADGHMATASQQPDLTHRRDFALVGDHRRPFVHPKARTFVGYVDRAVRSGLGRAERIDDCHIGRALVEFLLDGGGEDRAARDNCEQTPGRVPMGQGVDERARHRVAD